MNDILQKLKSTSTSALLGIDGMVDEVWEVIEKRHSPTEVIIMDKLINFGEAITERRSGGIAKERLLKRRSSGGFVANTGRAIANLGVQSTFLGLFEPFDEVFNEFLDIVTIIPVGKPVYMNVMEFSDGKIMMPNLDELLNLRWDDVINKLGTENIYNIFNVDIVGLGYWSNLYDFETIVHEVVSICSDNGKTRYIFHDFANLNKRTPQALDSAIKVLKKENNKIPQILSLNQHEGDLLAKHLDFSTAQNAEELASLVFKMREKIGISELIIHTLHHSVAATENSFEIAHQNECEKPSKTTGAGDTFNGAYMAAKLVENSLKRRLDFANKVAYTYVETGKILG